MVSYEQSDSAGSDHFFLPLFRVEMRPTLHGKPETIRFERDYHDL